MFQGTEVIEQPLFVNCTRVNESDDTALFVPGVVGNIPIGGDSLAARQSFEVRAVHLVPVVPAFMQRWLASVDGQRARRLWDHLVTDAVLRVDILSKRYLEVPLFAFRPRAPHRLGRVWRLVDLPLVIQPQTTFHVCLTFPICGYHQAWGGNVNDRPLRLGLVLAGRFLRPLQ